MEYLLILLIVCKQITDSLEVCRNPLSVSSCSDSSRKYRLRAEEFCAIPTEYHCLVTEHGGLIECCMQPVNISKGHMPRYNLQLERIEEVPCETDYYRSHVEESNAYRGIYHKHYYQCVRRETIKSNDTSQTRETVSMTTSSTSMKTTYRITVGINTSLMMTSASTPVQTKGRSSIDRITLKTSHENFIQVHLPLRPKPSNEIYTIPLRKNRISAKRKTRIESTTKCKVQDESSTIKISDKESYTNGFQMILLTACFAMFLILTHVCSYFIRKKMHMKHSKRKETRESMISNDVIGFETEMIHVPKILVKLKTNADNCKETEARSNNAKTDNHHLFNDLSNPTGDETYVLSKNAEYVKLLDEL